MRFTTLIFALTLTACVHSTIVPSRLSRTEPRRAAVAPERVEIYRTRGPYSSFKELGVITYRTQFSNLTSIYDQLRKDAAHAGALAIIDLKVTSQTHQETEPKEVCTDRQECNFDGTCETKKDCRTEYETKNVTTFLAVGTMIDGGSSEQR